MFLDLAVQLLMSLKIFRAQILNINTLFNIEVGVNITRKSCERSVIYIRVWYTNLIVSSTSSNAKLHSPSLDEPYLVDSAENYLGRCLLFLRFDPQGFYPPSSVWCRHVFWDGMQLLYFDISAKNKIKYEISKLHVEIDAILLCFFLNSPSAVEAQYIFPQAKSPGYNN